ncbi:MAG: glucose-6-phosphate dehydrogenase [Candidatus Latescibacteria bacterium]|jgi:glucose-6-phosphate 1-dehydrogenase|nr:glucose-6-phosphate dehydrogenase [Candidatus Latescibacterota bacterium]
MVSVDQPGDDITSDPCVIVIFGASGDLTRRKLVPALYSLAREGRLSPETQVLGVARTRLSDDAFREQLKEGVLAHGRGSDPESLLPWSDFSTRVSYLSGAYDDSETYRRLEELLVNFDLNAGTSCNRLFYLSTPPSLYAEIIGRLGASGLNECEPGWTRIIVEKPFGRDLASSNLLDEEIHGVFRERQVYRIDHYLGKETVQNLLTFRFANTIFELMWNRNYVDHVQISMTEQVGLEHRAGYYDIAGVVRDMFQNHMLQLLTLVGMEPPVAFNSKELRDEKVKVLQAIRPLRIDDGVWGQYIGYREDRDVNDDSVTPTFLAFKLYLDNWRWQGVPFYLRTGKSLTRKTTEVTLQFKQVPHQLFQDSPDLTPNRLSLFIQPNEGMHLHMETKVPGAGMKTSPVNMEFDYNAGDLPDAYERLLLDAIHGDSALFTRSDEIRRAWEIVDPMLKDWESHSAPPLSFYYPGTWGPAEAAGMMHREGREWLHHCEEQDG